MSLSLPLTLRALAVNRKARRPKQTYVNPVIKVIDQTVATVHQALTLVNTQTGGHSGAIALVSAIGAALGD